MHHVIVNVLRTDHQVANQFGVARYFGADGVFYGANRRDTVHQRTYAADALRKSPRITRITVLEDDLDASHHGAGRIRLGDLVAVHLRFDTEVTFDTRNRVDYDSSVHD